MNCEVMSKGNFTWYIGVLVPLSTSNPNPKARNGAAQKLLHDVL